MRTLDDQQTIFLPAWTRAGASSTPPATNTGGSASSCPRWSGWSIRRTGAVDRRRPICGWTPPYHCPSAAVDRHAASRCGCPRWSRELQRLHLELRRSLTDLRLRTSSPAARRARFAAPSRLSRVAGVCARAASTAWVGCTSVGQRVRRGSLSSAGLRKARWSCSRCVPATGPPRLRLPGASFNERSGAMRRPRC